MLFGESTSQQEAAGLLGQAVDAGVNCFDSAEMYPVPQRAQTQGRSEAILGRWLRGRRRYKGVLTDCLRVSWHMTHASACMRLLKCRVAIYPAPML